MEDLFILKTNSFEGPLPLLLNLIEKRKLLINEFSLSQITDDYISFIKNLGKVDISSLSNFISIGSTLLLIKSKTLLPQMYIGEEEEDDIKNLEDRLKIYELISHLCLKLKNLYKKNTLYKKKFIRRKEIRFIPDENINKDTMNSLVNLVINNIPKKEEKVEARVRQIINIEEVINNLIERVTKEISISFGKISSHKSKEPKEVRVFVIVSFLAMLELIKNGLIDANQEGHFNDITLVKV